MDSPRAGYRRAAAASWALAGLALTAVGGASALAYADTVKQQSTDAAADSTLPAPAVDQSSTPTPIATPVPDPPGPSPVVDQSSTAASTEAPVPDTAEPSATIEQAPPVVTTTATVRRSTPVAPTTSMAPNYSPGLSPGSGSVHTRSRGS
jgi:periplasmic protein TonB